MLAIDFEKMYCISIKHLQLFPLSDFFPREITNSQHRARHNQIFEQLEIIMGDIFSRFLLKGKIFFWWDNTQEFSQIIMNLFFMEYGLFVLGYIEIGFVFMSWTV